ncbi:hypothetical protein N431DRAFT_453027 [Stipitochalara longipes BDJ]|nr:hypothetical protein N431DRAFT_453027 [Stipitochalara longipes BDJ]
MNTLKHDVGPTVLQAPLTEFTLFPKLPPELRQKIFKDAIPTGSQGFRVLKVYGAIVGEENKNRKHKPRPHIEFELEKGHKKKLAKHMSLSRASKESRDAFLRSNPHLLRTKKEGLIRFATEDVIYVVNLSLLQFDISNKRSKWTVNYKFRVKPTIPNLAAPIPYAMAHNVAPETWGYLTYYPDRHQNMGNWALELQVLFQGVNTIGLVWSNNTYLGLSIKNQATAILEAAYNFLEETDELWKSDGSWANGKGS